MGKEILPNTNQDSINIMEQLLRTGNLRHKYAVRIQTVLNRAQGKSAKDIADFLGIHVSTISETINRFNEGGVDLLIRDRTRKAGTPPIPIELKNQISQIVCTEKPCDATHWSVRSLAERVGISHTAVHNILRERGLKPHQVESFQFSTDPDFEGKLEDVVGLYLNPPENAVVLCVDEKSQIQALQRSQPILPIRPGIAERQTNDYYRHGTTTLFAALNVATGKVLGENKDQHKSIDFISFLKKIDRNTSKKKTLHLVLDNYSAHKSQVVKDYLETKNNRFVLHFIPTHSSWLNLVERWFAEITNKQIRRTSWNSVSELKDSISKYIRIWNESGKKFHWVKTADEIKGKISRAQSYYGK